MDTVFVSLGPTLVATTSTIVTAAAFVPSLVTSIYAFCLTFETTKSPTEHFAIPVKSAFGENISTMPIV